MTGFWRMFIVGAAIAGLLLFAGCGTTGTDRPTTKEPAATAPDAGTTETTSDAIAQWAADHLTIIQGMKSALEDVTAAANAQDVVALNEACSTLGDATIAAAEDTAEDMPPGFEAEWRDAIVAAAKASDACSGGDYAGAAEQLRLAGDALQSIASA